MVRPGKPTPDWRFRDLMPEEYLKPDLNPYMKLHREMGRPVLTASETSANRGKWQGEFERNAPLHVEIGTGNGFFLAGMAKRHPEYNWVGLEIRFKRVVQTARKVIKAGAVDNTIVSRYNAHQLSDVFATNEIDALYINHPDPWAKQKQASHRLLSATFFETIGALMKPGSILRLKTDHLVNIHGTITNIVGHPFEVIGKSDNIEKHGAPWPDDIVTNYQRKFYKKGLPVYALVLRRV